MTFNGSLCSSTFYLHQRPTRNSEDLAIFDNYHLPLKNSSFDNIIFTDICGEEEFRCR